MSEYTQDQVDEIARRAAHEALAEAGLGDMSNSDIHEMKSLASTVKRVRGVVIDTFARIVTTAVILAVVASAGWLSYLKGVSE